MIEHTSKPCTSSINAVLQTWRASSGTQHPMYLGVQWMQKHITFLHPLHTKILQDATKIYQDASVKFWKISTMLPSTQLVSVPPPPLNDYILLKRLYGWSHDHPCIGFCLDLGQPHSLHQYSPNNNSKCGFVHILDTHNTYLIPTTQRQF